MLGLARFASTVLKPATSSEIVHSRRSVALKAAIDGGTVQLMINAHVPDVFRFLECRSESDKFPDLMRPPLGWSLNGPTPQSIERASQPSTSPDLKPSHVMFLMVESNPSPTTADDVEDLDVMKKLSSEELTILALMKSSVTLVENDYKLPL
ncbi:unnamed protein product [Clavelina lepadiformis]|uniref:Uncharacterized protein n=1 Tax=Clavelina lepadiformis TaxID=159417 RepID=A0ABP0GHI9_CLALP